MQLLNSFSSHKSSGARHLKSLHLAIFPPFLQQLEIAREPIWPDSQFCERHLLLRAQAIQLALAVQITWSTTRHTSECGRTLKEWARGLANILGNACVEESARSDTPHGNHVVQVTLLPISLLTAAICIAQSCWDSSVGSTTGLAPSSNAFAIINAACEAIVSSVKVLFALQISIRATAV